MRREKKNDVLLCVSRSEFQRTFGRSACNLSFRYSLRAQHLTQIVSFELCAARSAADDPDLFKRYRAANSVHVGKVSLTD